MNKKIGIVVFNLGGPDKLDSVKEFLFNLFYDPAILPMPNPFRWMLAKFISTTRKEKSKLIYQKIGGGSPILSITKKQAELLEKELNGKNQNHYKVFVSMRYWHPMAEEVFSSIEKFNPEEIILLPLYPQYSTTTTKSSFDEFLRIFKKSSLKNTKIKLVKDYYKDSNFIKAHVSLIQDAINKVKANRFRILFSAHSLPEYVIKNGDPYQDQVEQSVEAIVKELGKIDHVICYQSKVGRLKWIGPSTEDELLKTANEDIAVIIVPIAFVSDHSETLYELDMEYRDLFTEICNKDFIRVEALNYNKYFIKCLEELVLNINREN